MNLINFLSCSADLGNCCEDYGLAVIIDTSRRIVGFIQLVAPLTLIVMAMVQLIKLVFNPEEKNGLKSLRNKVVAAVIIFFIPMLVDVVVGLLPTEFSLSACWHTASTLREVSRMTGNNYIPLSEKKFVSFLIDPAEFEKGVPKEESYDYSGDYGAGAKDIVQVALNEIGNHEGDRSHHKYEAFNGLGDNQPWCAAFVTWCAGQAGYLDKGIFPRFVGCTTGFSKFKSLNADIHYASSGYNPKAGDITFFSWTGTNDLDHVGIVLSADKDFVYTVEGNTSCAGDAVKKCAGTDGVSKKARRRNKTIYAYVTPHYN